MGSNIWKSFPHETLNTMYKKIQEPLFKVTWDFQKLPLRTSILRKVKGQDHVHVLIDIYCVHSYHRACGSCGQGRWLLTTSLTVETLKWVRIPIHRVDVDGSFGGKNVKPYTPTSLSYDNKTHYPSKCSYQGHTWKSTFWYLHDLQLIKLFSPWP